MNQGLNYLISSSYMPCVIAFLGAVSSFVTVNKEPIRNKILHASHWLLIPGIYIYGIFFVSSFRTVINTDVLKFGIILVLISWLVLLSLSLRKQRKATLALLALPSIATLLWSALNVSLYISK